MASAMKDMMSLADSVLPAPDLSAEKAAPGRSIMDTLSMMMMMMMMMTMTTGDYNYDSDYDDSHDVIVDDVSIAN